MGLNGVKESAGIALVGAGNWGWNHLRVWNELGCLRLVVEPRESQRRKIEAEYPGVEVSPGPEQALGRDDIDGLVIAAPAALHAPLALAGLRAGKHVFVEKPLATTVADASHLVQQAAAANRVLMVGHILEYHPAFLALREMIHLGELGKVAYIYSHRLNFGKVRVEENALWSFAPHDIAMILRISGQMPSTVSCTGGGYLNNGIADTTMMQLAFPQGMRGHVFVSWLHPFKEHRFVVVGSEKMAVFDDSMPWEKKLALYPHRVDWLDGQVPVARRADAVHVTLEPAEPLKVECLEFLDAIKSAVRPLTDGPAGVDVLRVLDLGERSMKADGGPMRPGVLEPAPLPIPAAAHG